MRPPATGAADPGAVGDSHLMSKNPTREERERMCTRKRRYASQADALTAAALVGRERERKAYRCPLCGKWHLTAA